MDDADALDFAEELGPKLQPQTRDEAGEPIHSELVDTEAALKDKKVIALYFTAAYCHSCSLFTPKLKQAIHGPLGQSTQVVTISYDRTEDDYNDYCGKMPWLAVPFRQAAEVRGLLLKFYGIQSIPALVLLNAQGELLATDGVEKVKAYPKDWPYQEPGAVPSIQQGLRPDAVGVEIPATAAVAGFRQRFFTTPLLAAGHTGIGPEDETGLFVDENVVRCRAGLINVCTVILLCNVHFWGSIPVLMYTLYGIIAWDFLMGITVGLTPFAPFGVLASVLVWAVHPYPVWAPVKPKRFAWLLGLLLSTTCLIGQLLGIVLIKYITISMCFCFTWLEACLGFCCGCFFYDNVVAKLLGRRECKQCKTIYVGAV